MRKSLSILFCILFVFCFASEAFATSQKKSMVKFLYISELPEMQAQDDKSSYAQLAYLVELQRKEEAPVIFALGGNMLGPSVMTSFDKGAHIIGLLNMLDPTVMAAGRRDFIYREDELTLRTMESAFPIINANVNDPISNTGAVAGLEREYITKIGGHTFGFIALASPELGITFLLDRAKVTGGFELLPPLVGGMRERGVDFVVAMADFTPEDPQKVLQDSGVDMLIIGASRVNAVTQFGDQYYIQQGTEHKVLVAPIEFDAAGNRSDVKAKAWAMQRVPYFVALADTPEQLEMKDAVADYVQTLNILLDIPLATIRTSFDTLKDNLRTKENGFANIITDAVRAYYLVDIGLVNAGGIRGQRSYFANEQFTREDVLTELPLHDTSVLIEATGATLLEALEHGVSGIEAKRGRFLHVSGLSFTYNPLAPEGKRIISVFVGDKPLDPAKKYLVATLLYLAQGGDGFNMFTSCEIVKTKRMQQNLAEIVRSYLSKLQVIDPVVEGRIIAID